MKKVKKIKVKWRPRKVCAFIAMCSISIFLIDLCFFIWFAKIPDHKEVWIMSCIIPTVVFFLIIACIYIGIARKAKHTKMIIYCWEKTCEKNGVKLHYIGNKSKVTLLQRMFGLVTVVFWDEEGNKILFKDVSNEILKYL